MSSSKFFVLVLMIASAIIPSVRAEDAITSRPECIRVLTATSQRFIEDIKDNSLSKSQLVEEIAQSFDDEKVPTFSQLRKIRRKITSFHDEAKEQGAVRANLTLKASLALSYVEAAIHLLALHQGR